MTARFGHRGSVIAIGFAIDGALVGEAEARRRVLELWAPGAEVRAHGSRLVITGLRARRVRVAQAPGAPLIDDGGVIAALPVERGAFAVGAIVLAIDGAAEVVADRPRVELVDWIDISGLEMVSVATLGAPPVVAEIPTVAAPNLRALGGVAAADPAGAAVAAALARGPQRRGLGQRLAAWLAGWRTFTSGAPARATARSARAAPRSTGPSLLRRFVRWLRPRRALPAGAPASPSAPAAPAPPRAAGTSWLARLRGRLARALWQSRLGAAIGRRHAAYLQDLLELFDRGELDEALRRAIPFGGEADGEPAPLALGVPTPRADLTMHLENQRASSTVPLALEAMALLNARYRAAAERLEQQGRIDEAAFVLVDLLHDLPGAMALLERHRRFALAAQLAEARALEPHQIVRLWFLARDVQRAVDAARRHNAWAAAISHLAERDPEQANSLRLVWADRLATAGDFIAAIDVAWPVASARGLIGAWLERGTAVGGAVAARMAIKKLVIAPDELPQIAPAVLAILDDAAPEAARDRAALTTELLAAPADPALRVLARAVARALVRERAAGDPGVTAQQIEQVVRFSDEASLRVDLPALVAGPATVDLPRRYAWPAADAGAVPVFDAAALPGGRVVLALGELGVRVVAANGTVARIEQPAHRLVVSDTGTRALALAPRGQVQRIARLDLLDRRGAHWCDARCDGGAASFDGDVWLAADGAEVLAIDTTGERWRAIWGIATEGARCQVRRIGTSFAIEASRDDEREDWFYDAFVLRRRTAVELELYAQIAAWPSAQRQLGACPEHFQAAKGDVPHGLGAPAGLEVAADYAVASHLAQGAIDVIVIELATPRATAVLSLAGAHRVRLRIAGELVTIADDRGRVIVVDARTGAVVRELRSAG